LKTRSTCSATLRVRSSLLPPSLPVRAARRSAGKRGSRCFVVEHQGRARYQLERSEQKDQAIEKLTAQLTRLNDWLDKKELTIEEPLKPYIEALAQVRKQDLEVSNGCVRLRRGVAEDRRVSIEDPDMRHAEEQEQALQWIQAAHRGRPRNRPHPGLRVDTGEPAGGGSDAALQTELERWTCASRVSRSTRLREQLAGAGGHRVGGNRAAKPWSGRNSRAPELLASGISRSTCGQDHYLPSRSDEPFEPARSWSLIRDLRPLLPGVASVPCPHPESRLVRIAEDEVCSRSYASSRKRHLAANGCGHGPASSIASHIAARQGPKARYRGTRKNLFDLRRIAAVETSTPLDAQGARHERRGLTLVSTRSAL